MSTQDASGLEFSILPEASQQHFRLLELPPELLELLTSENAPTLQLKSPESTPGQAAEQSAVLCTPNKTFSLRQVNTSNSLFVTKLSHSGGEDEIPKPRLEAIAQTHFTLELQAANETSAATHIKRALPVYASTGYSLSKTPVSKSTLFSHVPASEKECEQAWTEYACFEMDGEALIPSASVKVKVWETLLSTATAEGIDLTSAISEAHVSNFVETNGSEWPREVALAVLRSMAHEEGNEFLLDEKKCARTIGLALLKDRTDSAPVAKAAFITVWSDLLPEKWRGKAELSLLEGSYKLEDGGLVFNDGGSSAANGSAAGAKAPAEAKSALGAKRAWHDKFRASKKKA